jgi:hypothetical protein
MQPNSEYLTLWEISYGMRKPVALKVSPYGKHLQKIIRKVQTTFAAVRHTFWEKCGLRPIMVHWFYTRMIRPSIFHGALVRWSKVTQKPTKTQLGRIQRMACITTRGGGGL